MTNKELYQSAMGKVSPRAGWQADTLEKLAQARTQQQAGETAAALAATPRRAWPRVALPMAAAALCLVVAGWADFLPMGGNLAGATPSAAAYHAQDQAPPPAAAPAQENAPQQDFAQEPAKKETGGQPSLASRHTLGAGAAANFDQGQHQGLPVLVWGNDNSAGAGIGSEFWLKSQSELEDDNPTRNLPQQALPTQLPVWRAVSGEGAQALLTQQLEQLAGLLKLDLTLEPAPDMGQGYPYPQLTPYCWYATAPRATGSWQLDVRGTQARALAQGDDSWRNWADKAAFEAGDALALQTAGGLQAPAHAIWPSYTYEGQLQYPWFAHFYYEAGQTNDSIETKLYNYTFKRVAGSQDESGALDGLYLTTEPKTSLVGYYPLRTLQQAKAALQQTLAAQAEAAAQPLTVTAENLVSWRLEYDQSPMNPYIQPVYIFTLALPADESDPLQQKGFMRYADYRVSALPPAYCIDWQDCFN